MDVVYLARAFLAGGSHRPFIVVGTFDAAQAWAAAIPVDGSRIEIHEMVANTTQRYWTRDGQGAWSDPTVIDRAP